MAISNLVKRNNEDTIYYPQTGLGLSTVSSSDVTALDVSGKGRLDLLDASNDTTPHTTTVTVIVDGVTFNTFSTVSGNTGQYYARINGHFVILKESNLSFGFTGLDIKFNKSLKVLYRQVGGGQARLNLRYSLAL